MAALAQAHRCNGNVEARHYRTTSDSERQWLGVVRVAEQLRRVKLLTRLIEGANVMHSNELTMRRPLRGITLLYDLQANIQGVWSSNPPPNKKISDQQDAPSTRTNVVASQLGRQQAAHKMLKLFIERSKTANGRQQTCLLYTSDAADE